MPLTTIKLAPGVNSIVTEAQGMAQITSAQLIRFKYAGNEVLAEKLGGWTKFYPSAIGAVPRAMHAWEGINNDTHLAIGCVDALIVISDGVAQDVTPQTYTSTIAPDFSTVSGDNVVTIEDTNLTVSEFDSIYILVPVSVGGIVLQGPYAVQTVLSATAYTILAASDATATVNNGGAVPEFTTTAASGFVNVELEDHGYIVGMIFSAAVPTVVGGLTVEGAYIVQEVVDADNFTIIDAEQAASNDTQSMNGGDTEIIYFISGGPPPIATGYGVGGYGLGGYGIGSSITPSPGTPITATNWTLDNWGEVLIATPSNGPIYTWSPDSGFPVATKIVDAPLINGGAFVSQPAQILVAWASSQGGVQDPLSMMWSDSGDYSNWTVSSQTQAGGYRLPTGSRIVGGCAGPNFGVIWTDLEVWAMDYIGPPFIFGFNPLGTSCGMIARHAFASLNSVVYWMGQRNFFMMAGERVETIPCSVWDYVFQDLDTSAAALDKIYVGSNSLFSEVWFFFPSASGGTGEVDSYVKFNPALNTWDTGRLARSAWIDQSPVGAPVGAEPTGYLYQHETSPDADGQPMIVSLSTGFFKIADGDELTFVDWMIPDFTWGYEGYTTSAVVQVTLRYCDYPNAAVKTRGPFSVSDAITYVNTRLRGRYVALTIGSSDLGTWWRMGGLQVRSVGDGRR